MTPGRILIVEDEVMLSRDMARRLIAAGYEVVGRATSGQEAVAMVEDTLPDLIIMDVMLEGEMDGIEAAGRIRARYDIPIVYLTAHADDEVFGRAKETEPLAYLTKPVSSSDLIHTVEMALYRHRMETRLRESEERFRQLAENVQEVFWLTYPGKPKRVIYLSPSHERIWGVNREEVYKSPGSWLRSLHPEDRESVVKAYDDFLTGQREYDVEYRVVKPDGTIRWVWDRAWPIRDEEGNLVRVAGLAQNITMRKEAEKRQMELMEEIKHFAYVVSHDLMAPLSNIKGFSRELRNAIGVLQPIVEKALPSLPDEERKKVILALQEDLPESLNFINSSITRMDHLIERVLQLSRLGRMDLGGCCVTQCFYESVARWRSIVWHFSNAQKAKA